MHLKLIVHVLSYALGTAGRYFISSFRISTVFDITARVGSFLKFLIFHKFAFVSNFIIFVFVFIF